MFKKHILAIVVLVLVSSQVYAHTIKLSPNESKALTNHSLWTLNATCNIQGNQVKGQIRVSVVENKGKVNGKNLSKGQATSINVKKDSSISVSAEPGTTVNLVNLSEEPVEALCYT